MLLNYWIQGETNTVTSYSYEQSVETGFIDVGYVIGHRTPETCNGNPGRALINLKTAELTFEYTGISTANDEYMDSIYQAIEDIDDSY